MRLTPAQIRALIHVRDHGQPLPRNAAAYHIRVKGLSEFVWKYSDGTIATAREQPPSKANGWHIKIVGERITDAGRLALKAEGGDQCTRSSKS
jgi:hypothetical protein